MYVLCVFLALLSVERLFVCMRVNWLVEGLPTWFILSCFIALRYPALFTPKIAKLKRRKKTTDTNNTLLLKPDNVTCFYFRILTCALLPFFLFVFRAIKRYYPVFFFLINTVFSPINSSFSLLLFFFFEFHSPPIFLIQYSLFPVQITEGLRGSQKRKGRMWRLFGLLTSGIFFFLFFWCRALSELKLSVTWCVRRTHYRKQYCSFQAMDKLLFILFFYFPP